MKFTKQYILALSYLVTAAVMNPVSNAATSEPYYVDIWVDDDAGSPYYTGMSFSSSPTSQIKLADPSTVASFFWDLKVWNRNNNTSHKVTVNFAPGTYVTPTSIILETGSDDLMVGWPRSSGMKLVGAGRDTTTIKLQLSPGAPAEIVMIYGKCVGTVEICNLTIDANYSGNSTFLPNTYHKLAGIGITAGKVWIDNVRVKGCGSFGISSIGQGAEVFPISISRRSLLDPSFDTGYVESNGQVNYLKVTSSLVESIAASEGGYGTGIVITTWCDDWGNFHTAELNDKRALVEDCVVEGTLTSYYQNGVWYYPSNGRNQMHAYGVAYCDRPTMIDFNRCQAVNTTGVFNADSNPVRNVTIRNGYFTCHQGVHVGNAGAQMGEFEGFHIYNNTFRLKGPFQNRFYTNPSSPLSRPNDIWIPFGIYFSAKVNNSEIRDNTISQNFPNTSYTPQGYCILIPYSGHNTSGNDLANGYTYTHTNVHPLFEYKVD
jgi:hypothetical protein